MSYQVIFKISFYLLVDVKQEILNKHEVKYKGEFLPRARVSKFSGVYFLQSHLSLFELTNYFSIQASMKGHD